MATAQQALTGTTSASTAGTLTNTQRVQESSSVNSPYPIANTQAGNFPAMQLLQRSLPGVIVVLTLFGLLLFYNWLESGNYRPLYTNLPESEKNEAFNVLAGSAFPVELDSRTGDIMVPPNRYYEARMLLASAGFSDPGTSQSLDIFNEQASLTTSQFMEEAQYRAATEIELSKSIVQISSIKSARVHLAAPRQSSYVRNRVPAKASVVVIAHPGRVITQSNVQSITNLVSSSVPYLAVEDVSVVDQQGNLLTMSMSPTLRMADMQATYERSIESDYQTRIEQLLAPIVGIENVNSDVDVVIDFSEFETTSEIFDQTGKGPLSRSEILSVDRNMGDSRVGGIPGAPSNLAPDGLADPNADGQQVPEAQTSTPAEPSSERTTRNYELDRSIQYSRNAVGTISRLSIAVVVNEAALSLEANEESDATEPTTFGVNLEQLTELVKNSVGFDEARGDQVLLIASPFVDAVQIEEIPSPWYENSSIQFIAQIVGAVIVLALALLFVVRPAMTSILARNRELNKTSGLGAGTTQGQAFQALSYDQRVGMMRQAASSDPAKVATAIKDLVQG